MRVAVVMPRRRFRRSKVMDVVRVVDRLHPARFQYSVNPVVTRTWYPSRPALKESRFWSQLQLCQGAGFDIPAHSTPHQVPSPNSSNTLPPTLNPLKHVHPILHDDFSSIKRECRRIHDAIMWLRICGSYSCPEIVRKMERGTRIARSCSILRASFLAPSLRKRSHRHAYYVSIRTDYIHTYRTIKTPRAPKFSSVKENRERSTSITYIDKSLLNPHTNRNETLKTRANWLTDCWECSSSNHYTEEWVPRRWSPISNHCETGK